MKYKLIAIIDMSFAVTEDFFYKNEFTFMKITNCNDYFCVFRGNDFQYFRIYVGMYSFNFNIYLSILKPL